METMETSDPMIKKKSSPAPSAAPRLWRILAIVFIVISIALLIALIVVATKRQKSDHEPKLESGDSNGPVRLESCADGRSSSIDPPKSSGVFDDLTVEEITTVRDYLLKQASLNLTEISFTTTVANNYIYMIQLLPPPKNEVLEYLDNNGAKPERKAVAVVFHGASDPPVVREYIVSPVSNPTKYVVRKVPGGEKDFVTFNARPLDLLTRSIMENTILIDASRKLVKLMKESYDGYSKTDCGDKCLGYDVTSPMGFSAEDRITWVSFKRDMTGQLDLSLLVDCGGADFSKWKILKVLYNNQTFDTVDELVAKYENNTINKIFVPAPKGKDALFSSYQRRGDPQPSKPMRGPEQYEPDGKRYTVNGRHVNYMSWSFDFRIDSNSGMQIYDIKFNGERIVYELSVQEAAASYAGYYPSPSWYDFLDGGWGMGMASYELVRGIDCPYSAAFIDQVHLLGLPKPLTIQNAVCVFELNTGMPLRRHYDNNFLNGYNFYGGMANQVLVMRTVATIYNYDYVFDFLFHQNGVIEVKVSASGYVYGAFYDSNLEPYAYPLHEHFTSGTHDHLINYKVDLDIDGRKNSYETIEIGIENITERWFPNRRRVQKVLKRSVKKTELEAAYKFNFDHPKYLNFFNDDKKNRMGVKKGYRIQLDNMVKQLYPEDWMITPMLSWSLYQMAVTKYKENETQSSSIYNQHAPTNPQLDFRKYLMDDDTVVNEDLVAWVTIGMMHIPHSEDLPNTATAANSASFFIRPFNYFDEDPSIGSSNAILITPIAPYTFTGQNVERYGTPVGPQCIPKKGNLDFNGTYPWFPLTMKTTEITIEKTTPSPNASLLLWKTLAIVFIVISIALLIALIVVATKQQNSDIGSDHDAHVNQTSDEAVSVCGDGVTSSNDSPKSAGVFDDLTVDEIIAVRDYLLNQTSLNLIKYVLATIDSNYIHSIQLLPPSKDEVLEYLDNEGAKPERKAVAVVFHGATNPPAVKEYLISSPANPTMHEMRTVPGGKKDSVPFNARPQDDILTKTLFYAILKDAAQKLFKLMKESYDGYTLTNCVDKCLLYGFTSPMGFAAEDRKTWVFFTRDMTGQIDLSLFVDFAGINVSNWKISKVLYNNQTFETVDELAAKYENNSIKKIFIPAPKGKDALFSSYQRRGDPQPSKPMRGPEQYEPDGKRYTVNGRHVSYMSWSFDFRIDSYSGMQIYDIKFNGERIVYELSLQEAAATYAGYYPLPSWNNFLDGTEGLGMNSFELVRGVDCPHFATFFDLVHMIDVGRPQTFRNAVCAFELNTGTPLRRHYDNNFVNGYNFYGGMADQVLVLRSISTLWNYDYVFDFIFYQNGVIEVKISTSGYIYGTFYDSNIEPYAYPLHENFTSGTHDHLINYKVDLDIGGRKNSYETIEIGIENITERWFPNRRRVQKVLKRSVKKTELEAAYKFNFDHPKYLNFFNDDKKNRMGVKKGYRIQLGNILKQLYPEDWMITPMLSWSLYQMAVTKYKENETQSSSIYNQNSPSDPQVDFRKYLMDDDSIVNEDLVAWVTIGMMHIPHSEDLPNTATAANSASFFIRPFNYFDEDPSVGSTNAILIMPIKPYTFTGQKVKRYGTPVGPECLPRKQETDFKGSYGV